ncbi:uncharacterized protein Tco025E_02338 [Trypanosoma conorhini]|uniref:Uncharacterized protein n=1 Tax=Trypanosoma conorhini TaxID=83891 RepID=A0A3R7NX02_9TRYP|nr:uncharacterized protein Tco025E_02338 [Trypanosoma conorhini]RNF25105.1 hypothetical protein Tco025E_02338 [Trypanosoma conorhini]
MTELSYHSSDKGSRELSATDVKQHEKKDVSDSYSDGFESASSREPSRASSASKGSGRGGKGPAAVGLAAHVRADEVDGGEGSASSRSTSTSRKHEACDKHEEALALLERENHSDRDASESVSRMSSVSGDNAASRSTSGKIDSLIQRLKNQGHAPNEKVQEEGKSTSPSPSKRPQGEAAGAGRGGESMAVQTAEDLSNLLAQNDELRMRVLENGRAGKYSGGHKRSAKSGKDRSPHGRLQLRKTTAAVQQALRREQARQELRGEREYLVSLRNQLRKKVLAKKRLHAYFSLIEDCKADISRLTEEKRALSLAIRQNERVLLNNEVGQASEMALKRLKEEMRAETVLTRRSLEKAQRDATEAVKMHHDAELRVQKLEEQLEGANKKEEEATENYDPEVRELIEENQRKAQKIQLLRRELRQLKSKPPNSAHHGAKEASRRDAEKERVYLVKRIQRLRKELEELSAKVKQQKVHEELRRSEALLSNEDSHTDLQNVDSAQKRHSSGADAPPNVEEGGDKGRELTSGKRTTLMSQNSWAPSTSTLSESKGDSIDKTIEELRHRVEQGRASAETLTTERRSSVSSTHIPGKPASDHTLIHEAGHSLRGTPVEPEFLQGENDAVLEVKHEAELDAPTSEEEIKHEARKELSTSEKEVKHDVELEPPTPEKSEEKEVQDKNDSHAVASWFDDDDARTGDTPEKEVLKPAVAAGLHLAEQPDAKEGDVTENAPAEVQDSTDKNAGMGAEAAAEEDRVETGLAEEEVAAGNGAGAKLDAVVSPPAPTDEPSWLDFD